MRFKGTVLDENNISALKKLEKMCNIEMFTF